MENNIKGRRVKINRIITKNKEKILCKILENKRMPISSKQ